MQLFPGLSLVGCTVGGHTTVGSVGQDAVPSHGQLQVSTVLGTCHQGLMSSQTRAEVGVGAQVMARAVQCHHWML